MKRSVGIGLAAIVILSIFGTVALAKTTTVFNPVSSRNVNMKWVSIDDIKVWLTYPSFKKWTNMNSLREYLAERGVDLSDLEKESSRLTDRQTLSLSRRDTVIKRYAPENRETAISDIDCDVDDGELEFELTNTGANNWFLVDQPLTTGLSEGNRKQMSGFLTEAKPIKLFINNFPANSLLPKYWMGEKLFYGEGQSFADSCKADFLRTGKTVDCELEPIPLRGGAVSNHYLLITPTFRERGTFSCN